MQRRSNFSNRSMTISVALIVVVTLIILVVAVLPATLSISSSSSFVTASSSPPVKDDYYKLTGKTFRCFRPFSSLRSFTPRDMTKKENCEFAPFMTLIDAKATVKCYSKNNNNEQQQDQAAEQKDGCYVTLNFTAEKFDPENPNYHPALFETYFRDQKAGKSRSLDALRYGLELKAMGQSTIRYKGFENRGYSACCSMLKRSDGEEICDWFVEEEGENGSETPANNENTSETAKNHTDESADINEETDALTSEKRNKKSQHLRVKSQTSCPLNDPLYDQQIVDGRQVYGKFIHGEITRPLHRKIFGKWEARIEFYRDDVTNGVGRVIIPFELKMEHDDDQIIDVGAEKPRQNQEHHQHQTSSSKEMESEGHVNSVAVVSVDVKEKSGDK